MGFIESFFILWYFYTTLFNSKDCLFMCIHSFIFEILGNYVFGFYIIKTIMLHETYRKVHNLSAEVELKLLNNLDRAQTNYDCLQ